MTVNEIYHQVSATATATVSAAAVTTLFSTRMPNRRGVKIVNHHATRNLFVYESNTATAPAAVDNANAIHVVGAGQTLSISAGYPVYIFVEYDSTGGATTGVVNSMQVA
jgi:hypothetical protein